VCVYIYIYTHTHTHTRTHKTFIYLKYSIRCVTSVTLFQFLTFVTVTFFAHFQRAVAAMTVLTSPHVSTFVRM